MSQNRAAFLDQAAQPLRVDDTAMYEPGPDEVLIKNHAWAIAPVDSKKQEVGLLVQSWPTILGADVAGEIESVGSNVTTFKKGDRVMGHCIAMVTDEPKHAGFSFYTVVPAAITAKIPASMSFKDACILPLAIDTAATGLYGTEPGLLGLPYPSLSPKDCNKTILIWGGASSVGAATIQLASASGVRVITTASPKNFDLVKRAGASEVFDYNSPSVVADVVAAIRKQGTFAGVYDAIALSGQTLEKSMAVAEQLGGGNVAITLPPPRTVPQNVTMKMVWAIDKVTHPVWQNYVPTALEQGKLLCLPPAEVVGQGLESIQKAIEMMSKGISAKKLVVLA